MSDCINFDGSVAKDAFGDYRVNVDDVTLHSSPMFVADPSLAKRGLWKDWTPNIYLGNAGVTKTTVGNGLFSGKYLKIANWVFFLARYDFGSTTSFGNTGFLRFTLPVRAGTGWLKRQGMNHAIVGGYAMTSKGIGYIRPTDYAGPLFSGYALLTEADGIFTHNVPSSWGSGDMICVSGWYSAQRY